MVQMEQYAKELKQQWEVLSTERKEAYGEHGANGTVCKGAQAAMGGFVYRAEGGLWRTWCKWNSMQRSSSSNGRFCLPSGRRLMENMVQMEQYAKELKQQWEVLS